jgi:hypothetical protein
MADVTALVTGPSRERRHGGYLALLQDSKISTASNKYAMSNKSFRKYLSCGGEAVNFVKLQLGLGRGKAHVAAENL